MLPEASQDQRTPEGNFNGKFALVQSQDVVPVPQGLGIPFQQGQGFGAVPEGMVQEQAGFAWGGLPPEQRLQCFDGSVEPGEGLLQPALVTDLATQVGADAGKLKGIIGNLRKLLGQLFPEGQGLSKRRLGLFPLSQSSKKQAQTVVTVGQLGLVFRLRGTIKAQSPKKVQARPEGALGINRPIPLPQRHAEVVITSGQEVALLCESGEIFDQAFSDGQGLAKGVFGVRSLVAVRQKKTQISQTPGKTKTMIGNVGIILRQPLPDSHGLVENTLGFFWLAELLEYQTQVLVKPRETAAVFGDVRELFSEPLIRGAGPPGWRPLPRATGQAPYRSGRG